MGTPAEYQPFNTKPEQSIVKDESLITGNVSSSSQSNNESLEEAFRLRKRLRFFFMNPVEKWNTKRRLPYKFVIQVIKIILVTYQLCIFGEYRYSRINYASNNKIVFSRIFLKSWDTSKEVISYPPVSGPIAVCKASELLDNVDYSMQKYSQLNDTLGLFRYYEDKNPKMGDKPLMLCLLCYAKLDFNVEPPVIHKCFKIYPNETTNFSLDEYLRKKHFVVDYRLLTELKLEFSLMAFSYKPGGARCSLFDITILFNNHDMDGLMKVSLQSVLKMHSCWNETLFAIQNRSDLMWHEVINTIVILVCSISFILCMRAVIRAQLLRYKTVTYFRRVRKSELSMEGRLEFWNFWYIMIIINDILIIIGSFMEGKISRNEYTTIEWSVCSLCLGTGTMLVWFGVLRYFGFFKNYNIVILTLKRAFPEMTRFLLCTLIIYAGFIFCGWLVLGPFHIKFRSLSRTSENLFSLVNGDDMFATFTILDSESGILWWYSRIYLYGFISLFIYVVLNLFLSVILDAYETIKEHYTEGFPKSDLQQFIAETEGEENYINNDIPENYSVFNQGPCGFLKTLFCWRYDHFSYFRSG